MATAAETVLRKLPALEVELARLESASAVKRLQRAFGYYLDGGQWDEAADLFSSDATLEMGLDGVYVGQARIRQYLHALGEGRTGIEPGEIHEWMQVQPVVHVAPDALSAKARWRAFVIGGRLGQSAFWGEGPYEVDYIRQDGVWKIAKLHWYQTIVVPYEGGWVRNRDANGGIWASRRLPPDQPPSERYDTWPGVYTPAFHYERPATALPEVLAAPLAPAGAAAALAPTGASTAASAAASAAARADARALDTVVNRFNALAQRVRRLRAIAEIENLVSAYGYYLDKQRWDAFTDLFTDDATMEISQRGIYVGKASIRRALELFGPQGLEPDHLHNHQQMQPVVHVSADCKRAWVRSRAFGQLGVHQKAGIWHGGLYENELVEVDGVWKFKTDHVYTTYFAHYDQGWMTGPRPTPKPSETIPPDRPPSVIYESFPEIFIPPFHYRHPVTGEPIDTGASGAAGGSGMARGAAGAGAGASTNAAAVGATVPAASGPLDASRLPGELRPAADRLSAIERGVQRLEDEQAIETLQRTYGYLVDKALWSQAADLFAADGTLEIGGRGVFVGRKRVLDYLQWLAPQGLTRGRLFDHLQLQPIVTVSPDGRSAHGRWRFFTQVGEYQKSALWGLGTYENEYVKRDGVWQIATLHSYFRMYTPYADGWAKTAVPNTRPEKDLPPDRPPTLVYDQYPSPFIPPCHYGNPVTGAVSGARAATGSDRG